MSALLCFFSAPPFSNINFGAVWVWQVILRIKKQNYMITKKQIESYVYNMLKNKGWNTNLTDSELIDDMVEIMTDVVNKNDLLLDVTQQRDMLIDFCNYLSKQEFQSTYWLDESDVDEFLKSNIQC